MLRSSRVEADGGGSRGDRLSRLTSREREVLELVADGLTNAQVAAVLWIAPGTVRRHLENVFAKLGVHTRTAAASRLRDAAQLQLGLADRDGHLERLVRGALVDTA